VVARFDNGDPALLEVAVSKGRVVVLTSGWEPDDSQLALSTKFVPLLYALLEESGAAALAPTQYHIGDTVPLPAARVDGDGPLVIRAPDGSQISLAAGETNFTRTTIPGIYSLERPRAAAGALTERGEDTAPYRFAVNIDPAESRTVPLPTDELERLGAPVAKQTPTAAQQTERKVRLQNAELEARQKLWRWFIVATMAVLLLETWLAGRTARRATALAGVGETAGEIPIGQMMERS